MLFLRWKVLVAIVLMHTMMFQTKIFPKASQKDASKAVLGADSAMQNPRSKNEHVQPQFVLLLWAKDCLTGLWFVGNWWKKVASNHQLEIFPAIIVLSCPSCLVMVRGLWFGVAGV